MNLASIIPVVCLMIALSCNAQQTSAPPAKAPPKQTCSSPAPSEADEAEYSARSERKAWILALKKFTESKQDKIFEWQPILNTVAGGLITAVVTFGALWLNAKKETVLKERESRRQLELARLEACITYADKLLDLRLKQLELFFAPLHALLQQSQGVYAKLRLQLLEDTSNYREVDDPEFSDGRKKLQFLWTDKEWHDWRLLDQMPPLKERPMFRPLIDQIMRIGSKMASLIAKYGGFSVDEEGASDVYGEYLAHYAILQSIHRDERTQAYPPGQHKMGYYPRRLNGIVETRYNKLRQELQPYLKASSAVLAELQHQADS